MGGGAEGDVQNQRRYEQGRRDGLGGVPCGASDLLLGGDFAVSV